ncbi:MAG: ATP-binding protein [Mariprofundaceae bacterium]
MHTDKAAANHIDDSHADRLSCKLNCCNDCIHVLKSMVEVVGARAGLNEIESSRMVLAVDELFANIARHGYGGKPGTVEMEASIHHNEDGSRQLRFAFRDFAPGIENADTLQGRCMDDVTPGGLGLHLIRAVMDEVHHEALPDGNRWLLVSYINGGDKHGHNN